MLLCSRCKEKPVARGIKQIFCLSCGVKTMVNEAHISICDKCSDKYGICQGCGDNIYSTPSESSITKSQSNLIILSKDELDEFLSTNKDNMGLYNSEPMFRTLVQHMRNGMTSIHLLEMMSIVCRSREELQKQIHHILTKSNGLTNIKFDRD